MEKPHIGEIIGTSGCFVGKAGVVYEKIGS
jgi:hypothetical protein